MNKTPALNETVLMPRLASMFPFVVVILVSAFAFVAGYTDFFNGLPDWQFNVLMGLCAFFPVLQAVGLLSFTWKHFRAQNTGMVADKAFSTYAFVVPIFNEDVGTIEFTLECLARHCNARRHYVVILAFEERMRHAGSAAVQTHLKEKFTRRFAHIVYNWHNLSADECAGKASNVSAAVVNFACWAEEQAINFDSCALTVMDSDSLISEAYMKLLQIRASRMSSDALNLKIFAPYMTFYGTQHTSWPVRVTDAVWSTLSVASLCRPFLPGFPVSTYTLTLQHARQMGYWETGDVGIGEDWHTVARSFFASGGSSAETIVAPFAAQHVPTFLARYNQSKRHAYGHQSIGYVIWKIMSCSVPAGGMVGALRLLVAMTEVCLYTVMPIAVALFAGGKVAAGKHNMLSAESEEVPMVLLLLFVPHLMFASILHHCEPTKFFSVLSDIAPGKKYISICQGIENCTQLLFRFAMFVLLANVCATFLFLVPTIHSYCVVAMARPHYVTAAKVMTTNI